MASTSHHSNSKLGSPPAQVAKVRELADQKQVNNDRASNVEQRILDRIKKCLQRAEHPNTPESEAHAAWYMASRLMAQHNVTQSELLEKTTDDDDYAALGGQSVVEIIRSKGDKTRVVSQTWVHDIAVAMTVFFDCKTYSTSGRASIKWTFYGIAANTVAAAMAFEMAHNLTLEWARSKTGRNTKHSYCLGIGSGLVKISRKEKREEKERAEAMERRRERSPQEENIPYPAQDYGDDQSAASRPLLKAGVLPCADNDEKSAVKPGDDDDSDLFNDIREQGNITDNSSIDEQEIAEDEEKNPAINLGNGEDENLASLEGQEHIAEVDEVEAEVTFKEEDEKPFDLDADFEEQIRTMLPKHEPETSAIVVDNDGEDQLTLNPWNTSKALVRFRQSAGKVASEYLKAQNKKLYKSRSREKKVRDYDAYRQGVEDSKQIDVKRRRITDA
ncbi:hypothetical protein DV736_g5032, partial [Chaetothyriales sp. CBS 134916]